jgi:hypothetical protein
MNKILIDLSSLLLLISCALSVGAQTKTATVHGELVEVTSYVKEGIKPSSVAGKEIAIANLGKGGALAMLEKGTNKLYFVGVDAKDSTSLPRLTGYLGSKIFVKGPVATRSGVRVITVVDIGKSLK